MPEIQTSCGRLSVCVALQNADHTGFLAHVARRLFRDTEQPFLAELDDFVSAQARRIALGAPPHVLYPIVANVRLPRAVALVELPGGEALYAEEEGRRVCVCVLRTDGRSVTFEPLVGAMSRPAEIPDVDWETVDMGAWACDEAADAGWQAWAESNIEAAPVAGVARATGREQERLLRAYVLPSLVALALVTSPLAEMELTTRSP